MVYDDYEIKGKIHFCHLCYNPTFNLPTCGLKCQKETTMVCPINTLATYVNFLSKSNIAFSWMEWNRMGMGIGMEWTFHNYVWYGKEWNGHSIPSFCAIPFLLFV